MSGVLLAARARRRLKQFGRISAPLGFLITATSLIILNTAIAAGNPFKVVNAEITDRSTGVEASIGSFSDTKISSDVTFYQLGDSVSYAVTLANNGGQDILINSITDDNSNSYISYIYNNHAGTELAAGDSLTLDIVAKYSTEIPDITARSQHLEVKFMIDYDEFEEEELDVPDTGVNTRKKADKHPVADPVVIAFMILGIILLVAGLAKSKVSIHTKALILILLGTIASTSVIKAAGSQVAFEFINNIEIKSLLSITYTLDGEEKTEIINYGDTLPLVDPDKPGYDFDGWVDGDGNPVDPTNPITDDITITAILTARTDTVYTVYHELENLTKTGFDLDKTETFQGTTDTEVTPATLNYDGFIAPSAQTITIKGDNSASVTYRYVRETYDVTIDPTDVIVTPANPETCAEGENPDECDPNAPINPVNPDDPTAPVDPIDPDDPLPYGTKIVLTAKDVEHYTFDHWTSSDSVINNKTDNPLVIIVTGPVDATPVYTGNPYTVTFNAESTEVSGTPTQASITTTYPALIGELPTVTNMTKIGYNFLGWYFEDGTTKLTSSFQPTENVTVYAHYEHVDTNFTINHRWPESPDSATMVNHEIEYVNCLIGDPILTSAHIKDYSPRAVVNAASAATNPTCLEGGSYNLDYDWMLYELSFASDEYKGAASTTGNFPMDKQVTIAAATRNNYTFDHWESSYSNIDNIQNSTYSFTMPAEDITDVTPIYRARVTFNPGDFAEVVETHRDIVEGDVLGALPNVINLDYRYEFDGWYTAATGGDEVAEDYVPAGNTTIFAHYTRKTAEYAVYHYVCDPDNITCDTIMHEDYDTANVGDEVTPDFYNFSSEYGNGLNNPSAKTTITIYENTPNIVKYIYTRKYFTLAYDNSSCVANSSNCISGSSTAAGQIAYGDSVSIEAEEVEHYRFDRWIITGVDNVDTQSESANFEMPDGDVVVKPTYLGLDYSVVFEQSRPGEEVYGYINGNNYINTVYPNAIGALPTISNINDENYDFVGWFLDDVDGSQLTTSYVPHEET
ncbi:InlB B-repeat-containing protein, partial [Candidatus Saccharibacteria bacterium]|nr:InlB B-repeat-containing protein [Candidatus Saccharibacteria bacterium]